MWVQDISRFAPPELFKNVLNFVTGPFVQKYPGVCCCAGMRKFPSVFVVFPTFGELRLAHRVGPLTTRSCVHQVLGPPDTDSILH